MIDGYIGNDPEFRTPARLYIEAANANIAGMQQQLYFSPAATARSIEPELTVDLHAEPEGRGLSGRPPDRGRPRAGRDADLQLGLLRRVEEGRAADVEQARLRPRRDPAARRLQDHPDRARQARRPDRRPLRNRQDDDDLHAPERLAAGAGRLRRLDAERPRSYATENGCFAKTFGLNPEDEPTIYGAVTQPDSYLENVSQHGDEVDFYDTNYTSNGRATFPFGVIEAASADEIDEAHFLLILNKNENIVPAVAKLEGPQAAAFFMLGETHGHERRRRRRGRQVPARARDEPVLPDAARPPGQPLPRAARGAPARGLPDEHRPGGRPRGATSARRRCGSSTPRRS